MAEAAKNPSGKQGNAGQPASAGLEGAPSPKASLSQKAEELAARLEAHKNQAQAEAAKETVAREAARKEAVRLAMSGKSETAAQPEASKPAAQKAAPAKPAAAPPAQKPAVAKPAAPAAANKPAEGKTVAAKTAPAKSAAAKPAAKPQAKEPVEDVIRAIKLPHELEAEKKTASQPEAPATSVQPQAEEPATNTAQQVPPVSAAPKTGSLPTTKAAVAQARNRVFGGYEPEPEPSEAAVKRRVARERALNSKPPLGRTAQVIVALVFPLLTLIAAIRLIATPAFLALSYARPGFPSDSFGFTDAERLTYGSYGVDYLNNFAGREYLAGLKLSTGSSMFTEGEVQRYGRCEAPDWLRLRAWRGLGNHPGHRRLVPRQALCRRRAQGPVLRRHRDPGNDCGARCRSADGVGNLLHPVPRAVLLRRNLDLQRQGHPHPPVPRAVLG
ncbi:hypothetical protein AAHB37_04345 [Glutamicibacter halophytocola]